MRWLVLLAVVLSGCAVKGYDLGWQRDDRLARVLGAPLDGIAPCRVRPDAEPPRAACAALADAITAELREIGPGSLAPEALGAECRADGCRYANRYERRDIGLATILPVYRKIPLRTVRVRIARGSSGGWRLEQLSVLDQTPPDYGPVRVGG